MIEILRDPTYTLPYFLGCGHVYSTGFSGNHESCRAASMHDRRPMPRSPELAPAATPCPEPCENPKNGSTLGLHNLHHRSMRVQNWGFCFLDPPRALGSGPRSASPLLPGEKTGPHSRPGQEGREQIGAPDFKKAIRKSQQETVCVCIYICIWHMTYYTHACTHARTHARTHAFMRQRERTV